jgi:RNA 2',3'-cyclic 3'-phosphodiesterase
VRLFVAVTPPTAVLEHADAAVTPVRTEHPDLRWIPVERWHLTLAFYGEIPDAKVDGVTAMVARKLQRAAVDQPVEVCFSGAGQFSRRALWIGLDGDVASLKKLAKAVITDRRPYRPHLTVARLRGGADARPAVKRLTSYAGPVWRVDSVRLMRSHLGPKPRYETLATWPVRLTEAG